MNSIFLAVSKTEFRCPHCLLLYADSDEKYLRRCNRNKSGVTRIRCGCTKRFYMSFDYTGGAVSFAASDTAEAAPQKYTIKKR